MPAIMKTELPSPKADKKSKKNKEKKRPREDDEATEARKNKRSKSEAPGATKPENVQEINGNEKKKQKKSRKSKTTETNDLEESEQIEEIRPKKEKKPKKHKDRSTDGAQVEEAAPETSVKSSKKSKKIKHEAEATVETTADKNAATEGSTPEKKKKKKKRSRRKSELLDEAAEEDTATTKTKKSRKSSEAIPPDSPVLQGLAFDLMDIDSPSVSRSANRDILQPAHAPSTPEFPFATQIVSLYVPLFPIGFDQPLTKVAEQHLQPLLNHYSPLLKGVLLDYRHVTLGELPVRADPRKTPTDRTPTLLSCKDEYAVGFGWLTAEVYLFVPRRGAWMEGVVNLQSEGHLGIVCWNRFNASIEATRVPEGWRFIDVVQKAEDAKKARFRNAGKKINFEEVKGEGEGEGKGDEEAGAAEEGGEDDQETLEASLQQMHATGYWVDAAGMRVAGKLRFRIKNFDVGTAGDHGYISIEGTMLDDDTERELRFKEKEREKVRMAKANPSGMLRRLTRSIPEFSMTSFGKEKEQDDSSKKLEFYEGIRPMTPS